MKRRVKKRIFGITAILVIAAFQNSCIGDEPGSIPFESQSLEKQREYVRENLKPLGKAMLSMAKDPEFLQILYREIEKKFDGEYNVLIKDLVNIKTESGKSLREKMEAIIGKGEIDNALNKFKGIEGEDYHPQIYIPFYEEIKIKMENANKRANYVSADPVTVFYDGNETIQVYDGYTLDQNYQYVLASSGITETYAIVNQVWVMSLNESTTELYDPNAGGTTGSTNAIGSAIINYMKIKCHKESWVAGASEVHILTIFSGNTISDYLSNEHYDGGQYQGACMHKFTRNSVKTSTSRLVDFGLNSYWDSRTDATFAHSVIFEYDCWPTGWRTATWNFNGTTLYQGYRSSDDYYDLNSILKTSFSTYTMNNGCIEWNGR